MELRKPWTAEWCHHFQNTSDGTIRQEKRDLHGQLRSMPLRLRSYYEASRISSGHQCDRRGEVQSSKAGMGKKYTTSHERVARRKRKLEGGRTEHASKALAHYPPELCSTLASMAYRVKTTRAKQLRRLERGTSVPWPVITYEGPGDDGRDEEPIHFDV